MAVTSEKQELKALSASYGAAMLILFMNRLLAMPLLWTGLTAVGAVSNEHTDARFIALMLANEAASYLLPLVLLFIIFEKNCAAAPKRGASYERLPFCIPVLFLCGVGAGAAGSFLTDRIIDLISLIFGTEKPQAAFSGNMPENALTFAVFLLCACVIAPICEEIIFRRFLLMPLRKFGDMTAAAVSSAIFALYHANFDQLAYTLLMGYFFAVTALRCDSVKPCVIMHVINNLIVGINGYLPESLGSERADTVFGAAADFLSLATVVMAAAGLLLLLIPRVRRALILSSDSDISQGRQLIYFCTVPVTVGGFAAMLTAFFI